MTSTAVDTLQRFAFDLKRIGILNCAFVCFTSFGRWVMGKPYSSDLRQRICAYVARGHSARAAGRGFGVSAATVVRFVAEHCTWGTVDAKRQGRPAGRFGKLAPHRLSSRHRASRTGHHAEGTGCRAVRNRRSARAIVIAAPCLGSRRAVI